MKSIEDNIVDIYAPNSDTKRIYGTIIDTKRWSTKNMTASFHGMYKLNGTKKILVGKKGSAKDHIINLAPNQTTYLAGNVKSYELYSSDNFIWLDMNQGLRTSHTPSILGSKKSIDSFTYGRIC